MRASQRHRQSSPGSPRVPIVPITYATSRRRVLATWDRFHLALPFGRGVYLWGEPIDRAADLDEAGLENARRLRRGAHESPRPPRPTAASAATRSRPAPWRATHCARMRRTARGERRDAARCFIARLTTALGAAGRCSISAPAPPRGKEDPGRFASAAASPAGARPDGPLVWIHAASVGEAASVLALIERPAGRAARRSRSWSRPARSPRRACWRPACRRAAPGTNSCRPTCRAYVARFLDHWRPDLALWVESELWPNLVFATQARGIPMVLVNARLSARSFQPLAALARADRARCSAPSICASPRTRCRPSGSARSARRARLPSAISRPPPAPLPFDDAELARLRGADRRRGRSGSPPARMPARRKIAARGASRADAAHARPADDHRAAPSGARRRDRARCSRREGLRVARRSRGEPIDAATDIYLADTLGELGLFYRLAGIAFIGGSLVAKGGHNPFEAARLDCAILHGPDMSNCAAMPRDARRRRRRRHRARRRRARRRGRRGCSPTRPSAARARRRGARRRRATAAPCSMRCWSGSRRGSTASRRMPASAVAPEFWAARPASSAGSARSRSPGLYAAARRGAARRWTRPCRAAGAGDLRRQSGRRRRRQDAGRARLARAPRRARRRRRIS